MISKGTKITKQNPKNIKIFETRARKSKKPIVRIQNR